MSRRSEPLSPRSRDGTSQRSRRPDALDPASAPIDERTGADIIRFVQEYARQLRFFEADAETGEARAAGTWDRFAENPKVSLADIEAWLADPSRFSGEKARWLGRPHFALLLAYVELLGLAREHLNGFTRRHLDYHFRELLQMRSGAPEPDHATVLLGLGPAATEVRLPVGTELQAGRDAGGVPRIYVTERDIIVNKAEVSSLRSVYVDRRFTGIPDVRADRSLTAPQALEGSLRMAIGSPGPGDPVPPWQGKAVDFAFLTGLRGPLDFAWKTLRLQFHELRTLMRLVRQRRDADAEWRAINDLMGYVAPQPANPRDFMANLEARVGALDFAADGLPQVSSVDDLYVHRTEPGVRKYIDTRLAPIGFNNFVAMMQIKLRIDAAWAEINRLLGRVGQRQRNLLEWSLPPGANPTDFPGNLALALGWPKPPALPNPPPPWPWGTRDIDQYETQLRALEAHLSMPAERLSTLVAFAEKVAGDTKSESHDWSEIDRILAGAHVEKTRAARRAKLVQVRAGGTGKAAFDATASFVLGEKSVIPWNVASQRLAPHLDRSQLDLLSRFRDGLETASPLSGFGWPDADRLFELAWRHIEGLPEPVAQKVEVRNVYAWADATQVKAGSTPSGWRTFGQRPTDADDQHPQGATLGWSLRSPLLSLSEGTRSLTLTLGLRKAGFDGPTFLAALGLTPADRSGEKLARALEGAFSIEVSTAKGWIALGLDTAKLALGAPGDDYWSLLGVARAVNEDRPGLQLVAKIDASKDALEPLKGSADRWPSLRLTLKPRWNKNAREWQTSIQAFEPLVLNAVNLKVQVEGLSTLRLQQDDRLLDPKKPFEPFGSRPAVGSRMYLHHPELVRSRLDSLRFDVEWMGLPDSLVTQYFNYPGISASSVFQARAFLVDRHLEVKLDDKPLFADENNKTKGTISLEIKDVPKALAASAPLFAYAARNDLPPASDVRQADRFFVWELTPRDFGHGLYPSLSATKARELAVDIQQGKVKTPADAAAYRVDQPYTPNVKRLAAAYAASIELDPVQPASDHAVLHVHPFGACAIDADLPGLLPRYADAGELYVGVRSLRPPQNLSLLLQLAEGTSDPDVERPEISWSYLSADRFVDLAGRIVGDTTSGLINSGIVEAALPAAVAGSRLPPDLYWLRVAVPHSPRGVCDVVAVRAQAVPVRFDDRGNDPSHYEQPLPVGTIQRLVNPDARISSVSQPFTSFGGRPGEKPELFDTRVSERLRHKDRALSAWDYERLVLQRFRQIYKAKCLSAAAGAVDVVVIPDIRELHPRDTFAPKAPANLLADIQAYLAQRSPAGGGVRVRNAQYVQVQVRLGVRFKQGVDEGFAQRRLIDDLVRFLSPWAFDEGKELMIGGKIYASSILDFVDRHDDVDFVAEIKLFRSLDGEDFDLVPPVAGEFHVATDRPDQVLVAAPAHYVDVIPESGYQQSSFTGINYARIELDFIVS
ncbi:MAG TPA: baseplate J/gp47 family protein [Myxococcaceae bacterium]